MAAEVFKLILDAAYTLQRVNLAGGLWLPAKAFDALSKEAKRAHHTTKIFDDGSIVCYGMRFHRTEDQYPWFYVTNKGNVQVDIVNKMMRCQELPGAQGQWKVPRKLIGP